MDCHAQLSQFYLDSTPCGRREPRPSMRIQRSEGLGSRLSYMCVKGFPHEELQWLDPVAMWLLCALNQQVCTNSVGVH